MRTQVEFCCHRASKKGAYCEKKPTHDVSGRTGFVASLCDEHFYKLLSRLSKIVRDAELAA